MFFRKTEVENQPPQSDSTGLREKCAQADVPSSVREVLEAEISRMEKTDSAVAEYSISLNYVETLLGLPWNALTDDNLDMAQAARVFDSSHAGLGQVRERVLEHLASRVLQTRRQASLLIVDDEPIARANLKHVLSREGYDVDVAANGEEALALMQRKEFDCIVTDLKMDRMDGLQLLEAARTVAPHTRFILVTGYATVDTAVQAIKTGAVHYLAKPIDLTELREAVRSVLENSTRQYSSRSPILCFIGPPGVGKTSVGRAIAEALGRRFYRMSLADLRDEAELRGHRRTYVGAMPGRIVQALKSVGVRNPVFMLDEMDKIGQDVKGDPAMALLEILDPEQNARYVDRYVEIPFDLSEVLFIATANGLERLAGPLLDRLEVVQFSGYSEAEKMDIATRFLLPRQLREHGLVNPYPQILPQALTRIIREYTNESGVRGLEREIARLCRKLARLRLDGGPEAVAAPVSEEGAAVLLGPPRFRHDAADAGSQVGTATGLVWSETGGEIIFVEATRMAGPGQLILTGSLGGVLKESAQIALSFIRSHAQALGVQADFFEGHDIHIHIPAGGVSKDGPSAGLTIAVALVSLLTGVPACSTVALSGELSLVGRVLPVSGVREKVLAALRGRASLVVLPSANAADIEALRETVETLPQVHLVDRVEQALALALENWEARCTD
ncbi:response regulator [Desulfovibrionales bacterium]